MKFPALEIMGNEIFEALKVKNTNKSVGVCPQIPLEARAFDRRLFLYSLPCVPKLKNQRARINVRLTCFLCCYTNSHHHFSHALPVAKPFSGVKLGLLADLTVFTSINADNLLVQLWTQKLWIVRPFLKIPFHKLISFYIHFFFGFRFLFAIVTGYTVLRFFI